MIQRRPRSRTGVSEPAVRPIITDTRVVERGWTHIGRLWSNGEPYLAVDAGLRAHWLGSSAEEYFDRIVDLPPEKTRIELGDEVAAVVGGDCVVRDDSWMEVLESADGVIAIVQASGGDYSQVVTDALRFAGAPAEHGTVISVPSGHLAMFSAACDGAGDEAMELLPPQAGPIPASHGAPPSGAATGLMLPARSAGYRVEAQSYTAVGDSACFARWLLIPHQVN